MKILVAVVSIFFASSAFAAAATWSATSTGVKAVCASGTCDAPSGATDGGTLDGAKGIVVTVCADSGQTLSGAGTVTAYTRDSSVALWAVTPDLNLSVSSASVRCQSFAAIWVVIPSGRVAWVPTGVTVSSGGVTVYVTGVP